MRVLREIDAHVALGPQGVQVAALIARCGTLTADEVSRLNAARGTARESPPGRHSGHRSGHRSGRRLGRHSVRRHPGAARDVARDAARDVAWAPLGLCYCGT